MGVEGYIVVECCDATLPLQNLVGGKALMLQSRRVTLHFMVEHQVWRHGAYGIT